jgi:hypothetical protein
MEEIVEPYIAGGEYYLAFLREMGVVMEEFVTTTGEKLEFTVTDLGDGTVRYDIVLQTPHVIDPNDPMDYNRLANSYTMTKDW